MIRFKAQRMRRRISFLYRVMNIVNCALFASFLLCMEQKPDTERLTAYYAQAMMTSPTRLFCRIEGKKKFSEKDIAGMKATAALNAADRNDVFVEYGAAAVSGRQRL